MSKHGRPQHAHRSQHEQTQHLQRMDTDSETGRLFLLGRRRTGNILTTLGPKAT